MVRFKLLMLPPQSDTTRAWATRLKEAHPEMHVAVADDAARAAHEVADADAAFGTLPDSVLAKAEKLRWLQAPAAAPPAGYYTEALIEHPLTVTNFRGASTTTTSARTSWPSCSPSPAASSTTCRGSSAAPGPLGKTPPARSTCPKPPRSSSG